MTRPKPPPLGPLFGDEIISAPLTWPPVVRVTDPVTSHESARETTRKDRRAHCASLLALIRERPGLTAGSYAALSGIEGAWKRISDLVRTDQAYYAGTAISPLTGRHCGRVWAKR